MAVSSVLGQTTLAATTSTDIYAVPTGYVATITTISMSRTTSGAGAFPKFRLAIRPGGETLASKHYILYDFSIAAGDYNILSVSIPLGSGDVVTGYADIADATINLYGTEELM